MMSDTDRARIAELAERADRYRTRLDAVLTERDNAIRAALANGASPTDITHIAGINRARVYQIRDNARR